MRYELLTTSFEISLAEGLIQEGRYAEARTLVNGTIEHCRQSGDAFALPELLRIKAAALKALGQGDAQAAESTLLESLALSQQQGARAWELRTTVDLARLLFERGQRSEAIRLLKDADHWGAEGWDTADLRQLDALRREVLCTDWPA